MTARSPTPDGATSMIDSRIRCSSCGTILGHTALEALTMDEALAQVEALRAGLDRERTRADGAEAKLAEVKVVCAQLRDLAHHESRAVSEQITRAEAAEARAGRVVPLDPAPAPCCAVTGNPCGTDTQLVGDPCRCVTCSSPNKG